MLASVVGGRCNLSAVLPADPPAVGLRGQRSRPGRGVRVARPQVLLETFPPCPLAPQLACASTRRSEEHTSELQSHSDLVCRLLLEKKNTTEISLTWSSWLRSLLRPGLPPTYASSGT